MLVVLYSQDIYVPMYMIKSYNLEDGTTGSWKTLTSGSISFETLSNPGMLKSLAQNFL